ncbi:MAG: hypothetical protein WBP93_04925 [Pyrinomonadaceae bacterium]
MLRSQNRKGRNASTHRVSRRASFIIALSLVGMLGLATAFVFSRSARASSARTGRSEIRGSARTITREFNLRNGSGNEASAPLANPATMFVAITVDRTDDAPAASACTAAANDCSLRGAVTFANSNLGTTINVPAGTYNLTISGAGEGFSGNNAIGDLDIRANNTVIAGAGAGLTIIQQTAANARVIEINPNLVTNFNTSISGVTISGGKETTGVGGGGIISGSQNNTLTVSNCAFTNNSATGAGTAGGGAISHLGGSLTITASTFDSNSTSASGGAVGYSAGDPLARKPSAGTLTVSGSTFRNNTAASSAGGGGALDLFNFNSGIGTYQVNTSSFSGNQATNGSGGAIIGETGPLTVTTSSFSGNQAKNRAGAIFAGGNTDVTYSRLVGNTVTVAGGGNAIFRSAGNVTANDNWWGLNTGPASGDVVGGNPIASWLLLRHSANPSQICNGQTSALTADIKGRSVGADLTTELNGLPNFPEPPATIFSNAVGGTISGASTQFVNGSATATFTATANGAASVDATADSQTITANITVNQNTTSDPADQTVCQGATANFSTTASGTGPFTFVWKKGATVLNNGDLGGRVTITTGGNTSSLSISGAQSSDADTYTVEASGECNTATQSATLTINESTSASALSDQTVCQGATANFSTTASGTGPFTYQWKLDGSDIAGATSSSVSIATGSLSTGNHTVAVVVGGACNTVTQTATLTVNEGTSATTPADQTVCQGANASFSTTASGTGPFTYQWKLDGSDIAGATGSSVSISTSSVSTGNHTVDVVVNGACGSVTKTATLTVQENTSATKPSDQTVCQGATANFATTASGTGPFTYQWKLDGSDIAGATSSSVSVPTGSLSVGNHTVDVVVGGTCGTVTQSATLTVNENTSATTPGDQTVCQGATASFSTTASGTGPFTYQWKLDGSNISGATNNSVSIATGSLSVGNHTVDVVVSGSCGTVTKSAALTVNENTSATTPGNQTVCQGGTANFSTTASGTGPFTYQWRLDGSNIAGATNSSVAVSTGSLSAGNHTVDVVVGGTCGTVTKSATLTVNTAPSVTTNPANQTVTSGNATFTASASGSPAPTVQWQVSTNGGASFTDIPGATSTTLTFATNPSQNGNKYRAVFTNSCGTAVTTAATLTTCIPATVATNPVSVANACVGSLVTFSASANGTPAPTVQWQVSTNGGSTFTNISGATSSTLTVTASVSVKNNQYRAVFTNACGTATTSAATLGVDSIAPIINISSQPHSMWPPNHKYETFNVTDFVTSVSDSCGSIGVSSVVVSKVTSDETENGNGDGNTTNDIVIASDCKSVQLRSERDGGGDGRVYTIWFKVVDSAGNVGTATAKVTVPANQGGGSAVDSGPHYTVFSNCP